MVARPLTVQRSSVLDAALAADPARFKGIALQLPSVPLVIRQGRSWSAFRPLHESYLPIAVNSPAIDLLEDF